MHELGISVYPDLRSAEEIDAYIEQAGRHGFTRLFSSMFNLEGDRETVFNYFKHMIEKAHENGIRVSLDVNGEFLDKMGIDPKDLSPFKEIGVDILRMDGQYGDERDIMLINNDQDITLEFNASMSPDVLADLIRRGARTDRILLCHNFYPEPLTGMKWNKFRDMNKAMKELAPEVPMAAFVSSNAPETHGVWDAEYGLPTVERMRNYPIDLQARLLLATDNVDDILIGNAFATEEEMEDLVNVVKNLKGEALDNPLLKAIASRVNPDGIRHVKVTPIKDITETEKKYLSDFGPYIDLGDSSEWIWRSRNGRFFNKDLPVEARPVEKEYYEPGDVVIVNNNYPHYAGEAQIIRQRCKNDGMRNIVGKLAGDELDMLDLIGDMDLVAFDLVDPE